MEVKIKKVNDTYARIIADKSTLMEIYNEFAYFVPNYKFMPKFRNTNWDGKIRYLNIYTGEIYLGLWIEVAMWCKKNGYEIDIDPDLKPSKELNEEKLDKFTKYLELDPEKFTPRYFQKTGVITAINERRGLILSPTSSGKSLMIYLVSRYLNEMNSSKILVVVPTVSLVRQMAGDFIEYNNDNEMDIHEISAGVDKNSDSPFVISTWQSIHKQNKKWFNQFDAIICDEAHSFEANVVKSILEKADQVKYKLGFTGTLNETKTMFATLTGLFGRTIKLIDTATLIEEGFISDIDIFPLILEYPDANKKLMSKNKDYKLEMDFICEYEKRNQFITKLAVKQKSPTLILFRYIKHGETLRELIEKKANCKVYYIDGGTSKEDREKYRQEIEKEDNCIIIASYGVLSTGVNIKNIHNIIFASPYKSKIKVLQSIGRGLRKHANKMKLMLYDVVDDLTWRKKQNMTMKSFIKRYEYYLKERFTVTIKKIKL